MTNTERHPRPTEICCLCGDSGRFKGDALNSVTGPCPLRCGWVAVADERDAKLLARIPIANLRYMEAQIARDLHHLHNPYRIRNADTDLRSVAALVGSALRWMAAMDRAVNA
jgi:hypothetical protein